MIMVHKFWLLVIAIFINVVVDQSNAATISSEEEDDISLDIWIPEEVKDDVYATKCYDNNFMLENGVKSST
uniref:Beta-arrestin-1 (Arrestin beta 1) n=1 Tax=Schistosoma japonicum TaxID=6182 RepID=C1LM24_SCHJA|nr:Beta-arrestin-1 (Arrestin beta 1) [Schistosoma japonicum]